MSKKHYILATIYCLGHILAWSIYIQASQNEAWFKIFEYTAIAIFLPLVVLTNLLGKLIWGSLNIFKANYLIGMFTDYAILSIVSTIMLFFIIHILKNRKEKNHLTNQLLGR